MNSKRHKFAARGARSRRSRLAPHSEVTTSSASSISAREPLIRTILVPVDFSDCSLAGLMYAVRLAKEVGARIIVLHVTDLGPVMMTTACGDYDSPSYTNAAAHRCADQMRNFLRHVDFDGVPVDTSAVAGYCPGAIHEVAAKKRADLIVIATHGRTGLRRAVLGSVAEGTVRHAVSPVLVVPSLATAHQIGLRRATCQSALRAPAKRPRRSLHSKRESSS